MTELVKADFQLSEKRPPQVFELEDLAFLYLKGHRV